MDLSLNWVASFFNFGTVALVSWIISWGEHMYKERHKLIIAISCVYGMILTMTFFIILIFAPNSLMMFEPPDLFTPGLYIQHNGLTMISVFVLTSIVL